MSKTLTINSPEDLKKLEGWTIKGAKMAPGINPQVQLRLSHPAAENDVILIVIASSLMGLSGNVVVTHTDIGLKTVDFEEKSEQN